MLQLVNTTDTEGQASGKTWNKVVCLLGVMQRGNLPMFGRDHDPKGLHVTAPVQAPRTV